MKSEKANHLLIIVEIPVLEVITGYTLRVRESNKEIRSQSDIQGIGEFTTDRRKHLS